MNVSWAIPTGAAICGETSSVRPMAEESGQKAALGTVSRLVAWVINADSPPLAELAQPAGNPGGVTESKLSEKTGTAAARGKKLIETFVTEVPTRTLMSWPLVR